MAEKTRNKWALGLGLGAAIGGAFSLPVGLLFLGDSSEQEPSSRFLSDASSASLWGSSSTGETPSGPVKTD